MTIRSEAGEGLPRTDSRLEAAAATVPGDVDLLDAYQPPDGFLLVRHGLGVASSGAARTVVVPGGPDQVARAARAAEAALTGIRANGGARPVVVGALPFDGLTPAILTIPRQATVRTKERAAVRISVSGPGTYDDGHASEAPHADLSAATEQEAAGPPGAPPPAAGLRDLTAIPTRGGFADAVRRALERIDAGHLQKVVLARMLVAHAAGPLDRRALLERLRAREPDAYAFAVHGFVGATPELLVARSGDAVIANPLAGTTRRGADPDADHAASDALLASPKDRWEHALVVEAVRAGLAPAVPLLQVPEHPATLATGTVWHLSTLIHGRLTEPRPSSLSLASLLHPTPAVCGTPTDAAMRAIRELEPFDRTLYAGLVGWMDTDGNGEWAVALRCAEIQGNMASLFAGAGIVRDSDPQEELAETDAKFDSMLGALGADAGRLATGA
jgi:isochorismate synthase